MLLVLNKLFDKKINYCFS